MELDEGYCDVTECGLPEGYALVDAGIGALCTNVPAYWERALVTAHKGV
jgi:hypothetical protein